MKLLSILCFLLSIICFAKAENIKCIECSSNNEPNCAQKPDDSKLERKVCANENITSCFTKIDENGVTTRGCLQTKAGGVVKTEAEDVAKTETETKCEGLLCICDGGKDTPCNDKIHPEARQCRQCKADDKECSQDNKEVTLPCVKYEEKDECYTQIHDDGGVVRGCKSDGSISCADNNKRKCDMCTAVKDTACNNNLSGKTCYECSSENDKTCIRSDPVPDNNCTISSNIKKCTYLKKTDEPGYCFALHKDGIVKRGCAPTDADLPTNGNIWNKCKDDSNCNNDCRKDIKCIQCKPDDKNNCSSLLPAEACPAYTTFCQQCESEDHKQLIRQCGDPTTELACTNCEEEGCNNAKLSCYFCDSSKDPNCAQWRDYESFSKPCPDGDKCMLAIKDGHTLRGCSSEIKCDDSGSLCLPCEQFNCNGGLFPSDRRICYQCINNDACNAGTDNRAACTIYDPEEECYMFGTEKSMTRGCLSDKNVTCTDPKCVKCKQNNCNDSPYMVTSKMACIKCNPTDEACLWGYKKEKADNCGTIHYYYEKEECFIFTHDKNSVTRDCALNSKLCESDNEKCKKCDTESGCNNENIRSQKCIRCVSVNPGQESCADTAQGIPPSECKNPIQPFENRGCYKEKYFGTVFRGCASDLLSKDFESCRDKDFKSCDYCYNYEGCNNGTAPNSGVIINAFSAYTLFLFYLINKNIMM